MKNKFIKISALTTVAADVFMASGWSFFKMTVQCKKKKKLNKKKWFNFSKTKINHPRDKFEKEYEGGKEWCRQQNMQDCYIQSIDGLKLHASYLPAKDAKRFVLLSHGYKGSGFGDRDVVVKARENISLLEQKSNMMFKGGHIILQKEIKTSCLYISMVSLWELHLFLWHQVINSQKK